MSRFRRSRREVPGLNTSSLPDLIFTVLFFFMIVTTMRQVELKVRYHVPQGTEVEKVEKKSSVIHIYIGQSVVSTDGQVGEPLIQVNDRVVRLDEVGRAVNAERNKMSTEDRQRMTVSIKADRDVEMGIISDVKQELARVNALRINYSATKKRQ